MSAARPLQRLDAPSTVRAADRPAPLTEAELGALVGAARGRGVTAVRNRALVALLAASGCKLGEALRLLEADVDLAEHALSVRDREGGTQRTARLLPAAAPHVEAWRLVRARLECVAGGESAHEAPFFCTRAGGELEASYVRRLLPRLAQLAGLDRAVNARLLRATFAAHVYRLGASLSEVQHLLGHGDTRSTLHLVRPVLEADRDEAERPFRPEQWTLPGAAGTMRVELTVRSVASAAENAAEAPMESASQGSSDAPAPDPAAEPAQADGRTIVAPARWREL